MSCYIRKCIRIFFISAQYTSNEYPQHMFLWRNKKNISTCTFLVSKTVPYLELYRVDMVFFAEEIVSLMTLSSELRPQLHKVMVIYSVYMNGVKRGEVFELQSQKATLLLTTLYNTLMSCDTLFDVSSVEENLDHGGRDHPSAEMVSVVR